VIDSHEKAPLISPYEEWRWAELQEHWARKADRRQFLPPKAQKCARWSGSKVGAAARKAGGAVSAVTPTSAKDGLERVADAALVPTVEAAVHLLELVTDWTTELAPLLRREVPTRTGSM
jgi:hypothetical protein